MNWREHIDRDPKTLAGKPKIKGTRISVEMVLERLGEGWSNDQLREAWPHINPQQVRACLAFAAEALATDDVVDIPLSAA